MDPYEVQDGETHLEWVIGLSMESLLLPERPEDAMSLLAFCRRLTMFCSDREKAGWLFSRIISRLDHFPSISEARAIYSERYPLEDEEGSGA